jgi:hypothetical protein
VADCLQEKLFELRNGVGDDSDIGFRQEANFHVLYGSLLEGYKRNEIALHFHFFGGKTFPLFAS